MFSIVDHFNYAKEKGQKAIAAFEAYVVGDHKERTNEGENARQHLVLFAKNSEGYRKLSYLCSIGCTDGFYYRPRIDDKLIESVGPSGMIASSACIGGRIPQLILNNQIEKAEETILYYKKLFEDFYLEIQPTMDPEQVTVNQEIIKLARKLEIPLIATSDYHYAEKEHSLTHEVLLAMQSGKLLSDPNRWKFPGNTFYIASRKQMEEMFNSNGHEVLPKDAIKESLDNTIRLANSCEFDLETDKHYLPNINIPIDNEEFINWHKQKYGGINNEKINDDYLRYLCIKGLKSKNLTDKEYKDRLDYELRVIGEMGFNDYFLIYYDIIKYCSDSSIPVGPGRGCFSPDNIVSIEDTVKKIQDFKGGEIVKGHDEKEHKTLWTYEYDCDEEVINLETEDNKSIKGCTKDHEIYAIKKENWDKGIRTPQWYKADDLDEGDMIAALD